MVVYSVAYKHPRRGKLIWFLTSSNDVMEASGQARDLAARRGYLTEGFLEYGHSRTEVQLG